MLPRLLGVDINISYNSYHNRHSFLLKQKNSEAIAKTHRTSSFYKVFGYTWERKHELSFDFHTPTKTLDGLQPSPDTSLKHYLSTRRCSINSVTLFPIWIQDISEESVMMSSLDPKSSQDWLISSHVAYFLKMSEFQVWKENLKSNTIIFSQIVE